MVERKKSNNMVINKLLSYKESNDYSRFYKEIEDFLPDLKRYVRYRLYSIEQSGIIPRSYFKPEDIVDEVITEIFAGLDANWTEQKLRTELFRLTKIKIDELLNKESNKPEMEDINKLLEEEIRELEERLTVDAEGELVLEEDLDDIEYKQEKEKEGYLLFDRATEERILNIFDKDKTEQLTMAEREIFGMLLKIMPARSKAIVELYVFGGLSTGEISDITEIKLDNVNKAIDSFVQKLRKLLK